MVGRVRAVSGAVTLAVTAALSMAAVAPSATASDNGVAAGSDHPGVRQALRRLVEKDGVPGALAEVRDRHGRTVITSGVGNTQTGAPVPRDGLFRIGSKTKTYLATVILQLAGQHKVALDAPVERYLPGVVSGNGNDGREITVRNLLQHTSGLPDYLNYLDMKDTLLNHRFDHHEPGALVKIALAHPRLFKPGERWSYSNTNYVLAGMIIKKATGHSYGAEIRRRILWPLRLRETSVPGDKPGIPGPHAQGYLPAFDKSDPPLIDLTRFNPSVAGAAGEMISSGSDHNRFLDALVHGRLLHPAELREMMTTRPVPGRPERAYGLGLISIRLSCGVVLWGHGGDIPGYSTRGGVTLDGRHVTVMTNLFPAAARQHDDMDAAVTEAICESR